MSDPSGTDPEQRLPAPRPPSEVAPVDRFAAPASAHQVALTPERAAGIVRQSASARWVGFLAALIIVLFVILYWFYELGIPTIADSSRLAAETEAQSVTRVENGYNLYEANCARCHGAQGQGGIGPILNDQAKLYTHLNSSYINNVLTAGGRYVCGNADSLMPIWAQTNGGPLNYKQIEALIEFIRAPDSTTYTVRDPSTNEPLASGGKTQTFTGWRDPNYAPPPGATPVPACWSATPKPIAATPIDAPGPVVAQGLEFTTPSINGPADKPFTLDFDNQASGVPHNIDIKDSTGTEVFKGEIFNGVAKKTYDIPALKAGTYPFSCSVHPTMTGTLTIK
jgi:mono/diheme cytochrome c family protein